MSARHAFDAEDAYHAIQTAEALLACVGLAIEQHQDDVITVLNPSTLNSVACLLGKAAAAIDPAVTPREVPR